MDGPEDRFGRRTPSGRSTRGRRQPEGPDDPFSDVDEELTAPEEEHLNTLGLSEEERRRREKELIAEESMRPPPESAFFTDPPLEDADLALVDADLALEDEEDEGSV